MAIEAITSINHFDSVVGVVDSMESYHIVSPSLKFAPATSVIKEINRMHNEVFKFHIRMDDVELTKFKIMLGCDAAGVGRAIQFDFDANNKMVRYVNQSGIDVAYDSVIKEKDITNISLLNNAEYVECKVVISINKVQLFFQNRLCMEVTNFTTVGTNWGFCNLTGSSIVYLSDLYYIYDQILYGNVNLNGAPDSRGIVSLYNQATYELVKRVICDMNGEYMIFIDDDPANFNKYFLYGYVDGLTNLQPRGVSNITL